MRKSVVLFSGGLDSTVALYRALEISDVVAVLCIDYAQQGRTHELDAAQKIWVEIINTRRQYTYPDFLISKVDMNTRSALFADFSLDPKQDYPSNHFTDMGLPRAFVPSRNLTMLSLAASLAFNVGATIIYGGWSGGDIGYPDCNPLFFSLAEDAINAGLGLYHLPIKISVRAPFINSNKATIIRTGAGLKVPFELTRSCYAASLQPCLKCDACLTRIEGFREAGIKDPTVSEEQWKLYLDTQ